MFAQSDQIAPNSNSYMVTLGDYGPGDPDDIGPNAVWRTHEGFEIYNTWAIRNRFADPNWVKDAAFVAAQKRDRADAVLVLKSRIAQESAEKKRAISMLEYEQSQREVGTDTFLGVKKPDMSKMKIPALVGVGALVVFGVLRAVAK